MKKVLINLVILVATAINITGVMGQTATNDHNAICIKKLTAEQGLAQLNGSAKWEGQVSRDVVLNEGTENLNRAVEQANLGFSASDKDYFANHILPLSKVGTLDPLTDDPIIGGRSGTDKVSYNNNPDFTSTTEFRYVDLRSLNNPSEVYRIYLYRVECNNPVQYFKKLDEEQLYTEKLVRVDSIVYDSIPYTVYVEKLVEVPGSVSAMPDIINNNYNTNNIYPTGSSGGYSEGGGGNYWTEQPSSYGSGYGYSGGSSCYNSCFLCMFLGYLCPMHCGNSYGGGYSSGGCNYQQSCQASTSTGGTNVTINEGDVIVEVVVEDNDTTDDGDDDDDGDGDGGPDGPDDDDDDTGDDNDGPNVPDDDDINTRAKPLFGSTPTEGTPVRDVASENNTKTSRTKPVRVEVAEEIVKEETRPIVVVNEAQIAKDPKGDLQEEGIKPIVVVSSPDIKSNPKGEDVVSEKPVVVASNQNNIKGDVGKNDVASAVVVVPNPNNIKSDIGKTGNNDIVVVAPNPTGSKGNVVKSNPGDAVAVAPVVKTDPKGKVVNKGDAQAVAVDPVIKSNPKGKVVDDGDAVAVAPVISKGKVVKDNAVENQGNNQNNTVRTEDRKKSYFAEPTTEDTNKGKVPKYGGSGVDTPKNNGGSNAGVNQQRQQGGKNQVNNQANQSKSKSKVAKKKVGG